MSAELLYRSTVGDLKLRVYRQGASLYVMGTNEIADAIKALTPQVLEAGWGGSFAGPFTRRQGRWRKAPEFHPPKDSRPGVGFIGVKSKTPASSDADREKA